MNPDALWTIFDDVRNRGLTFEEVCKKHLPDVSQFHNHVLVCMRQKDRAFSEVLTVPDHHAAQKETFRFIAPGWAAASFAETVVCTVTCPYKIYDLVVVNNLDVSDYIKNAIKDPPGECPICKDDLFKCEREYLPCAHYYHKTCIGDWMKSKNTCPECRAVIDPSREKTSLKHTGVNPFAYTGPPPSRHRPNEPFTFGNVHVRVSVSPRETAPSSFGINNPFSFPSPPFGFQTPPSLPSVSQIPPFPPSYPKFNSPDVH